VFAAEVSFARTLSSYGFSSSPRQGAYANTRRLDYQQIAGKLARVDASDLRYPLSFRRARHAIEFQQDYATNLQPLPNDQLAKIAILRDEDAVVAICLV
jgi:hypothetical protein